MKFPWTTAAVAVSISFLSAVKTNALPSEMADPVKIRWSANAEGAIKERLKSLPIPFQARYDAEVYKRIKRYATAGYRDTEYMLGRAQLYFPIFEHYLRLRDLPLELKYLPIVESALRPKAVSAVGATGLWQFMRATGSCYDLRYSNYVDERQDIYRSTEAAVNMLADLYKQFGDWPLALAAYNCGPGRVRKAIRLAGSKDFWKVRPFLPTETRNYIPAFIAAAYIANHYDLHNLTPVNPYSEYKEIRLLKVYDYMTFADIAYKCKISKGLIAKLNPGYLRGIIPMNTNGNNLVLPIEAVPAFKEYEAQLASRENLRLPEGTFHSTYVVNVGDRIEKLAQSFHVEVDQILEWNHLKEAELAVNQEITLYLSRAIFLPDTLANK